jgi:Ca2+-binding EF-hand superfamily protein
MREMFQRLDANGDGAIEPSEVPEDAKLPFERLLLRGDSNHDGKLDASELRALVQSARAGAGGAGAMPAFEVLDSNHDGKLTPDEMKDRPGLFRLLDVNSDGVVTREEARALAQKAREQRLKRLKAMDKDGDGSVSRQEFTGPAAMFDRLDTNKDGSLSTSEIEQVMEQPLGGAPGAAARGVRPGQPAQVRPAKP